MFFSVYSVLRPHIREILTSSTFITLTLLVPVSPFRDRHVNE